MGKKRKLSRENARALKLKFFYTGKVCIHGHRAKRYTSTGICHSCSAEWYSLHRAEGLRNFRKYARKNPEKVRASCRKWYRAHPGKGVATSRNWQIRHPERVLVNKRRWREKNIEKERAWVRRWIKANPEKVRILSLKRRALKNNASGSHTIHDVRRLFFKQSGRCADCDCSIVKRYDVDHKTPLSRGGSNYPRNLQLLCSTCNSSKGSKTMREWRAYKIKITKNQQRKVF